MTDINTSNTLTLNLTEDSAKAFSKFCKDMFPKKEQEELSYDLLKIYHAMRVMNTTKTYIQFENGIKVTCEIDLSEYHEDK